ncbi:hypothetical protein [Lunatibacter salilacus]|uniref:hypothetical protein n=1 Tax=Lunatibacter salilacus TaxID=2483804 RepID=UPI00131EB1DF|nr:hypothetical protein [Lunatibacter salilacus]
MFNIEEHKKFVNLISPISEANIGNGYIDIHYSESKKDLADSLGLKNEKYSDILRIEPIKDQIFFFKDLGELCLFMEYDKFKSLLVFDGTEYYSFVDGATYKNFRPENDFFLFTNSKCYCEFISYLRSLVSKENKEFHFIDSYSIDSRRITMISFSEKGRLTMNYSIASPNFATSIDYRKGLTSFIQCFKTENKSLPKFLKSEIIKFGQNFEEEIRFKRIFESLENITEKANINFEVYLNEVSVEKLKKDYDELKTKYFKELSETLGKITQKLIGLPIGVSASLIAIDRVSGSPQFLYLLLVVIISTSVILSVLINSNLKDLNYLKKIFSLDYEFLSENKFFKKHSTELELFSEIKDSFMDKQSFYFVISQILFFVMNIANIFVILFIFRALQADETAIYVILGGFVILMFWYWFEKMKKR